MELVSLIILVAIVSWFAWKPRAKQKQDAIANVQQSLADQRKGHFELLPKIIERFAKPHISVLRTKRRQLRYKDDYGKVVDTDWRREMEYFLNEHVRFPYNAIDGQEGEEREFRLCFLDALVSEADRGELATFDASYDPSCSGVVFEGLVETIFVRAGAKVRRTPTMGDQGVDLLVEFGEHIIAVQCKRTSSTVGNTAVQEVSAGRQFYGADEAWVVSDAPFTKAARQLADSLDVHLLDFRQIDERLNQ